MYMVFVFRYSNDVINMMKMDDIDDIIKIIFVGFGVVNIENWKVHIPYTEDEISRSNNIIKFRSETVNKNVLYPYTLALMYSYRTYTAHRNVIIRVASNEQLGVS